MTTGQEWLIDVEGCETAALKDQRVLSALFESLVVQLQLKVLGTPQWHTFPEPGGITGLAMLAESHLAIHTFPEHAFATLNVYCCRTREQPGFADLLQRHLKAGRVLVRTIPRGALP